ncbi:MAG: dihydrofolate reductase [Bacteroidota bacterium]
MIISAIVATANNRVIGKNNDIPWYLPADLKYFKATTIHHHIIMGRNCYESIGRPLPKRTNIIMTRNPFFSVTNCLIVHSLEEALQIAQDNGEEEVFIIGGAQIYELSLPYLDRLYLTEVDLEVKGDVFFPELDWSEWQESSRSAHQADEKNPHDYVFKVLERVKVEEKKTEEIL